MPRTESEPPEPAGDAGTPQAAPAEATRREAVRRLGTYAAYTAPALVALLSATRASAIS